jgi:HD-GYP domain-containing protein (c-di-GMP phosphodiesterase class II)
VKNHPLTIIDLLKNDLSNLSPETITIIKQHHERPDGQGFPVGVDHKRINQLSAILIVSQRFVDRISENGISTLDYAKEATTLREEYHGGFFTKATNALVEEVAKFT